MEKNEEKTMEEKVKQKINGGLRSTYLKLLCSDYHLMQAPLELVGLGSSSSMDSFASWNGSGMEKEEREEAPLPGEDESRSSSPP